MGKRYKITNEGEVIHKYFDIVIDIPDSKVPAIQRVFVRGIEELDTYLWEVYKRKLIRGPRNVRMREGIELGQAVRSSSFNRVPFLLTEQFKN